MYKIAIFEAKDGMKRSFDKWVSEVSKILDTNDIFEWFSLNIVDDIDAKEFIHDQDLFQEYLDKISQRYEWLARYYNNGELPSVDVGVTTDVRQKVKSFNFDVQSLLNMGINSLRFNDYYQGHQNFMLWLKSVAIKLDTLSTSSGLLNEWLSLPVMTFYIGGTLIGGTELFLKLVDCVEKRIDWLGKLFKVDVAESKKQIEGIRCNPIKKAVTIDAVLTTVKKYEPTKESKKPELTEMQRLLADKEWLNIDELSIYIGKAKGTIYNYNSEGKIPHSKKAGLSYNRKEIDKWMQDDEFTFDVVKKFSPKK